MIKSWQEVKLERENRDLRNRLKSCSELIEDLSNLDKPLFEADVSRSFKVKYIRTISRARRILTK